jgi:hypothetical protein
VQHDDVRLREPGRVRDEVPEPPLDALLDPALARERRRLVLVGRRELDVRRTRSAGGQQLELDGADPAAALEHAGIRHAA